MPWLVIHLVRPRPSLRGYCRRYLLEPATNLFVGVGSALLLRDIVERIESAKVEAVVIVGDKKREMGMRLKVLGPSDRKIVDCDGISLVMKKRQEKQQDID